MAYRLLSWSYKHWPIRLAALYFFPDMYVAGFFGLCFWELIRGYEGQ